jgi:hypothetical protein
VAVVVRLNRRQLDELVHGPGGPVVRMVERVTRQATNAVRVRAPVDTGVGRASIRSDVHIGAGRITGRIFMARHMWYQAKGTGIYGPTGSPIRPKTGTVLVFRASRTIGPLRPGQKHPAPGRRGLVFARQVKGVPPNDFVIAGVRAAVPWPVRHNR